jgi:pentatricopeptide repeat protein
VSTQKAAATKEDGSTAVPNPAKEKAIRWKVKKHLEYLDNNFKIAEHVERTLERGDYDEALLLVREASRKGDVVVSWNHLISYLMRTQRLHAAVKIYNEVRALFLPHSRTHVKQYP